MSSPLLETDESVGEEHAGFAWIHDTLGEGMERKSGFNVSFDGGSTLVPFAVETPVSGGARFSNPSYPGLDFVQKGSDITWHIRGDYLPLYTFSETEVSGYESAIPIRAYYTVGLTDAVLNDSESEGTYFWTNLFDQGRTGPTDVGSSYGAFSPRIDNPYYYKTNSRVGLIGAPFLVGLNTTNFTQFVRGNSIGNVSAGNVLSNVYVSAEMLWAQDSPLADHEVGTIINSLTVTPEMIGNAEFILALKSSLKDCTTLASPGQVSDSNNNYAFKAGNINYPPESRPKTSNNTDSLPNVSLASLSGTGVITRFYGNNGRVFLFSETPIEKEVDKEAVKVGENITYLIHVKNPTQKAMNNITVNDVIEAGLEIISASDSPIIDGNKLTWTGINLAAGATKTLTVVAKATHLAPHEVENGADFIWLDRTIESNIVTTTVEAPEDTLSITKAVSKTEALAGDELTYTMKVENDSDLTWTNVKVTDTIPAGLTLVPGSITDGGLYNAATRTITWTIASLAGGAEVDLSFKAVIPEDVDGTEVYRNTAVITEADGIDTNIPSNEVVTTVTAKPDPDGIIEIGKTVDKSVANPGDTLLYSVTVTNTSDTWTWRNVVIEDDIPPNEVETDVPTKPSYEGILEITKAVDKANAEPDEEITYQVRVENTSDTWLWNDVVITDDVDSDLGVIESSISHGGTLSGGTITWSLGTLGAGDVKNLSFKVTAPDVEETTAFYNTAVIAQVDGEESDLPSNTVQTVVKPRLNPATALSIRKVVDKSEVRPGDELNYFIHVQNNTTETISSLVIEDEIRSGITVDESSISHGGSIVEGIIKWFVATLGGGEELVLSFRATAPSANEASTLYNSSVITSVEETDTNVPSNETETRVIPRDEAEDVLTIKKSTSLEIANPGDEISYTLTVENTSEHEDFDNVIVSDEMPEGLELVAGSISHDGVVSGNEIRWAIVTLGAGDIVNLTFRANVPTDLDQTTDYVNIGVIVGADDQDVDIPSNEVTTTVEIAPPPPPPDPDDDPLPDSEDLDDDDDDSDEDTDTVIVAKTGDESANTAPLWLVGIGIGLSGLVVVRRLRKREQS